MSVGQVELANTTRPQRPVFLTPQELSARYGGRLSVRTLANWWSVTGTGPMFIRMGGKILYPLDKVEQWERANTFACTGDYGRKPADDGKKD